MSVDPISTALAWASEKQRQEHESEVARLQARVAELSGAMDDLLAHVHSTPTMSGELQNISLLRVTCGRTLSDAVRWAKYVISEGGEGRWLATHDAEVRRAAIEDCAKWACRLGDGRCPELQACPCVALRRDLAATVRR
jgi:hypothetical protein